MTKWQTRQALYLLGLTGILYLFSCKSQVFTFFVKSKPLKSKKTERYI